MYVSTIGSSKNMRENLKKDKEAMRMKKLLFVVILSSVFLFAGCSKERWVYGQALEMQSNDEVGIVSFTMREGASQEIGILLTDETSIEFWIKRDEGRSDGKGYRLSMECYH